MKQKILQFLAEKGESTPGEIAEFTGLSRQYVHRKLSELIETHEILKLGKTPLVFYQLNSSSIKTLEGDLSDCDRDFLNENFIEITEDGNLLKGIPAFSYWCQKRNLPLQKTISEYRETLEKYKKFRNDEGFLPGIQKLNSTKGLDSIKLKELFYLDFYAIERFGKTLMGQLLHFAKQGQNKKLSLNLIELSSPSITKYINSNNIEAVGFIPPTIKREVQFMFLLEKNLKFKIPKINIIKVKGEIIVPQKALSKIEDRVLNAKQSIIPSDQNSYNRVLLIDDAVGSGATLNETAKKILQKNIGQEVYGLAITGSFKGFEVISEA